MVELLGITADYSGMGVTNAYYLLTAATWNGLELGRSLGYKQGKKFTMFAPTDDFLSRLPMEQTTRLLDPVWSRHLDDLLKHWITDRSYSRDHLRQMAVSTGGQLELLMLNGETIHVVAGGDDGLALSDGTSDGGFLKPSDLRAVNG